MGNIVAAIISAGAIITVAIIGAIASIWNRAGSAKTQLETHDEGIKVETTAIKVKIDAEATAIKVETTNIKDAIATANTALKFLENKKREELGAQKYLDDDRKTIVNNTRKLATEFESIVAENATLRKTNEALLLENKNQQQEIQRLHARMNEHGSWQEQDEEQEM